MNWEATGAVGKVGARVAVVATRTDTSPFHKRISAAALRMLKTTVCAKAGAFNKRNGGNPTALGAGLLSQVDPTAVSPRIRP